MYTLKKLTCCDSRALAFYPFCASQLPFFKSCDTLSVIGEPNRETASFPVRQISHSEYIGLRLNKLPTWLQPGFKNTWWLRARRELCTFDANEWSYLGIARRPVSLCFLESVPATHVDARVRWPRIEPEHLRVRGHIAQYRIPKLI
jgi:hypothetical protein